MSIKVAHTQTYTMSCPCVGRIWQTASESNAVTGGIVKKDEAYVELEAMKMIMPLKALPHQTRKLHGTVGKVPVPGWITRWYYLQKSILARKEPYLGP